MPTHDLSAIAEPIQRLARERPGPFYLYETAAIRARCESFRQSPWADTSVHFATMANANPAFLRVVRDAGLNVFVNSVGHLDIALGLGWRGEQIVYTASAMDEGAMRRAHEAGAVVNLDSAGQLEQWWRLFPGAPVGIRCNVGELVTERRTRAGYFLGRESRLGLTLPEIRALAGDPRICGLHLYVGTDITDLAYFEECYRALAGLVSLFPQLRYLDFGGGFGLPDGSGKAFDMVGYRSLIAALMDQVSRQAGRPLRLLLEPGRLLAGESGHFVCRVTDVKTRGERQLIGANASSAQFPRPLFYPEEASHPVALLSPRPAAAPIRSAVYGCSTYSRDFLAREAALPPAQAGDLLVFGDAGAYSASAHTAFLGFPAPEELFL